MKQGDWRAYEAAKRSWKAANPHASPTEYDAAMRRIARLYGV